MHFFEQLFDSQFYVTFDIPDAVFQGLSYLTKFVGYFFPLKLYLPIIILILTMVSVTLIAKLVSAFVGLGTNYFAFLKKFKAGK